MAEPTRSVVDTEASTVAVADEALRNRPLFTIRLQVYLSVSLLFLIVIIMAVITISTSASIQRHARMFEVATRLLLEIEQARRFEKNFFLHGTGLDDALENVAAARSGLRRNGKELASELSDSTVIGSLRKELDLYANSLESWEPDSQGPRQPETAVRRLGRKLLSLASELELARQQSLNSRISSSRWIQYALPGFLLLYIVGMTYVLVRRIVAPIRRLMDHMRRIAAGDNTPIMPARGYRDEFSALAVSINDMLGELERRQDILVKSHKLRAVGTLTAGVAHELNNPLNNIGLTVHAMLATKRPISKEEWREMLDDINHEVDRTKKIVAGLLDFSRQSESQVKAVDLGDVVRETVALVGNQARLRGASVIVDIAPHLPKIHGDAQQLSQVIMNLLLNAVAVTEGGEIEVTLAPGEEGYLELRCRDHGPGIPDHVLPHIFDPFFTTKPRGEGTGLGLAICKGIVNKHGGDLTVETVKGEGTTFVLHLPVTSIPMEFTYEY